MSLLHPGWLGLLALGGIILLFHSLRPKRQPALVPSLLLWRQVEQEMEANARWRRLVSSLLLYLHLVVLALLVLALAQPAFDRERPATLEAVVIDASASMAATDVAPSRFDVALERAAQHIRTARGDVLVIVADANPHVIHLGPADSQALAPLQQVTPFGSAAWSAVADLLQASGDTLQRVFVYTDGVVDADAFAAVRATAGDRLEVELLGGHAHNVAITAFEARRAGAELDTYQLLVSVRNFGPSPVVVPFRVLGQRDTLWSEALQLAPGEERRVLVPYRYTESDVLRAEIEVEDALASDNAAYLVVQPPPATRVALVGAGSAAFERGLRIFPHITFERRILLPPGDARRYDMVIFDGTAPPSAFTGWGIVVGRSDAAQTPQAQPVVTWWDRTHPITRFVDWSQLRIAQAAPLPEGAQVLVDSSHGPLVALETSLERRLLHIGFSLEDSDFPTRVGFPIFLSHLLDWAAPVGGELIQPAASPGRPHELPSAVAVNYDPAAWQVSDPQGRPLPVRVEAGRATVVPGAARLYTISGPEYTAHFAVRPPGPLESSLEPQVEAVRSEAAWAEGTKRQRHPAWRILVVLIVALLFVEAWLYLHRGRKPGGRSSRPAAPPLPGFEAVGRSGRGGGRA